MTISLKPTQSVSSVAFYKMLYYTYLFKIMKSLMKVCDEICLSYLLPFRFELHLIQNSTINNLAYALRNLDDW